MSLYEQIKKDLKISATNRELYRPMKAIFETISHNAFQIGFHLPSYPTDYKVIDILHKLVLYQLTLPKEYRDDILTKIAVKYIPNQLSKTTFEEWAQKNINLNDKSTLHGLTDRTTIEEILTRMI